MKVVNEFSFWGSVLKRVIGSKFVVNVKGNGLLFCRVVGFGDFVLFFEE